MGIMRLIVIFTFHCSSLFCTSVSMHLKEDYIKSFCGFVYSCHIPDFFTRVDKSPTLDEMPQMYALQTVSISCVNKANYYHYNMIFQTLQMLPRIDFFKIQLMILKIKHMNFFCIYPLQ